jgi:hypothetical protein
VAYCTKSDLLIGDIPLAAKYGDGAGFVNLAADEIDAEIGHLYVTPIDFDALEGAASEAEVAKMRPSRLLLKKINTLLASGRIILDMAAGTEDDRLHSYGASMISEARDLLEKVCDGKIFLQVPMIGDDNPDTERQDTKISVVQDDGYSLVQNFYDRYSTPLFPVAPNPLGLPPPARPYEQVE